MLQSSYPIRPYDMTSSIHLSVDLELETSNAISLPLMVCSHERSGTHFLMNSIANRTGYTSSPWINYDFYPLGSFVNFSNPVSVRSFLSNLTRKDANGNEVHASSIIKSHFYASHLDYNEAQLPIKFVYVWREPAQTLISFWKYLHSCHWNEGPKAETPLELAQSKPSGQSQRYQSHNVDNYFSRWAHHVIDGIEFCKRTPNSCIVKYEDLCKNYDGVMSRVCRALRLCDSGSQTIPDRNSNVIHGSNLELSLEQETELRAFCQSELEMYPLIKGLLNEERGKFVF